MKLKVIYEDNHLLVVDKPINVPMQLDSSNDLDLLTMCKDYLKEKYNKPGNVYCALLHRLDRPVSGVCIFAKTSKAASRLSSDIQAHKFKKEYLAVVYDNGLDDKGIFEDISDALEQYLDQNDISRSNVVITLMPSHLKGQYGSSLLKMASDLS